LGDKVRQADSIFRALWLLMLATLWIASVWALWQDWASGSQHKLATALLIAASLGLPLAAITECRRYLRGERFLPW
jgi:hypothetical protein